MLETIREYAAELLEASGEAETAAPAPLRAPPGAGRGGARPRGYAGADPQESLFRVLDQEHDNLRAALAWAADAGEIELEVRLAVAARWYWVLQGHLSEGRRFFDGIFARTADAPRELRALALVHGAIFPFRQGDTRLAAAWLQESLDLYRELGDEEGIARATAELGGIAIAEQHLDRAAALYEEAVPLFREPGPAEPRRGLARQSRHDRAHAWRPRHRSPVLHRGDRAPAEAGDEDGAAVNLHNLARSEFALGRAERGLRGVAREPRDRAAARLSRGDRVLPRRASRSWQ